MILSEPGAVATGSSAWLWVVPRTCCPVSNCYPVATAPGSDKSNELAPSSAGEMGGND